MTMSRQQRARRAKLSARILEELARLDEPVTATHLAQTMGEFGRATYTHALIGLVEQGRVESVVRNGICRYAIRRDTDNARLARTRQVLYLGELRHYDTTLRSFMKLCEGAPWRA
jgi:hypothetical protein